MKTLKLSMVLIGLIAGAAGCANNNSLGENERRRKTLDSLNVVNGVLAGIIAYQEREYRQLTGGEMSLREVRKYADSICVANELY